MTNDGGIPELEKIEHELNTLQFYMRSLKQEIARGLRNPSHASDLVKGAHDRTQKMVPLFPVLAERLTQGLATHGENL